jgi:hypothetical protein
MSIHHLKHHHHFKKPNLVVLKSFHWENFYDKPSMEDFRRIYGRAVKFLRRRFASSFIAIKIDPDMYTTAELLADSIDNERGFHRQKEYTNVIRYWGYVFPDVYLFDHALIFERIDSTIYKSYFSDGLHINAFSSNIVLWTMLRFLLTDAQANLKAD